MYRLILKLLLLTTQVSMGSAGIAHAGASDSGPASTAKPAESAPPHLARRWLSLMHYQPSFNGHESTIDYDGYFFAPDGATNPEAEFAASRAAIRTGQPAAGPEKGDPVCVFPARARFFHEVMGDPLRAVTCEGIAYWRERLPVQSVSLVFSTAYSGNPASLFGHSFLKLNLTQTGVTSTLTDYAASFAAATGDAGMLEYVVKGVSGGFRGTFSVSPYYERVTEYVYSENRDLWEYEFRLTPAESLRLIEHLWELQNAAWVDYYFFDDNCSYMLMEVLDAVFIDTSLSADKRAFVLPAETVKTAVRLSGRTVSRTHRPSHRKVFNLYVDRLNDQQYQNFRSIIARTEDDATPLPGDTDSPTLDAVMAWTNLQKARLKFAEQTQLRNFENKILVARARLGAGTTVVPGNSESGLTPVIPSENRPDLAHDPSKTGLDAGLRDGKSAMRLRWRYGLHDLTDPDPGYEPWYHVNYLDLSAEAVDQDRLASWNLTVGDFWSLVPWRGDDPIFSWKARGGLMAAPFNTCIECPVAYGEALFGLAAAPGASDRLLGFALAGPGVYAGGHVPGSGAAWVRAESGLLWRAASWFRLLGVVDWTIPQQRVATSRTKAHASGRLQVSADLSRSLSLTLEGSGGVKRAVYVGAAFRH